MIRIPAWQLLCQLPLQRAQERERERFLGTYCDYITLQSTTSMNEELALKHHLSNVISSHWTIISRQNPKDRKPQAAFLVQNLGSA